MNAHFLSWLLHIVAKHLRMSRGGSLLLNVNPKGYELAEHIATKVEVNIRMLSTLKNEKSIWRMKPGRDFDTSVVRTLGVLVALIKRQIGQGYSKSGIFSGILSMSSFLVICFSLVIETWPKRWLISWEFFFKVDIQLVQKYSCLFEGLLWQNLFEDSIYCFESGRVISKNYLEGQQSNNVQEVQT